jgi:SRSO17 transposase
MTLALSEIALSQPAVEADLKQLETWTNDFHALMTRLAPRFKRAELRERVKDYLQGLFSSAERKNSWQLAEQLGQSTPYGIQHLLGRAQWSADAVRDELQTYVNEALGDPEAVFVVDETGFLKKGEHSAGVQPQYSGTAHQVENCQIGVFLSYAARDGYTLIDRELYLPQSWIDDPERCAEAGIPREVTQFTTKPKLAQRMLERAFAAGIPGNWVAGDEVYCRDRSFRQWLKSRHQAYVLSLWSNANVGRDALSMRVDELAVSWPPEEWQRLSCGTGTKGERYYDWTWMPINSPNGYDWQHWVLVRRGIEDPADWDYFLVFAPPGTTLETIVKVAGQRWTIEVCFESAKGEVGLDEYEVRSWTGWYRHITLALVAHAFLTITRSAAVKKGISTQVYPFVHPSPPRSNSSAVSR